MKKLKSEKTVAKCQNQIVSEKLKLLPRYAIFIIA
jgi:hypothetical protein